MSYMKMKALGDLERGTQALDEAVVMNTNAVANLAPLQVVKKITSPLKIAFEVGEIRKQQWCLACRPLCFLIVIAFRPSILFSLLSHFALTKTLVPSLTVIGVIRVYIFAGKSLFVR
jgi:hypothetical protein